MELLSKEETWKKLIDMGVATGDMPEDVEFWNLETKDFNGANLSIASLCGVNLSSANLNDADLSGTDLSGANLSNVSLKGANMSGADLSGTGLRDGDLSNSDLFNADLRGANLNGANLRDADLIGADLHDADFSGADLRGAKLNGTYFIKVNLSGANLSESDLRGTTLIGTNLNGVDLTGANLTGVDLRLANLNNAVLDNAILTETRLYEIQRDGWSIKGVICERASWDRDGEIFQEYEEKQFEIEMEEKPVYSTQKVKEVKPQFELLEDNEAAQAGNKDQKEELNLKNELMINIYIKKDNQNKTEQKLLSVFLANIKGFTGEAGQTFSKTLELTRNIFTLRLDCYNTLGLNTWGDAVFSGFEDPVKSIEYILQTQSLLETSGFYIRIGMDYGKVRTGRNHIVANGLLRTGRPDDNSISLAGKLELLCNPGRSLISGELKEKLAASGKFSFEDAVFKLKKAATIDGKKYKRGQTITAYYISRL